MFMEYGFKVEATLVTKTATKKLSATHDSLSAILDMALFYLAGESGRNTLVQGTASIKYIGTKNNNKKRPYQLSFKETQSQSKYQTLKNIANYFGHTSINSCVDGKEVVL